MIRRHALRAGDALNEASVELSDMTGSPSAGLDRLDLLQTFVRIVDTGSLSAAARQLKTTQPTISRRLQWLEQRLGLRLLQRSTRAMKLTDDGERCYAHAKLLLESWDAVEADLRGSKDRPRGHLRVLAPHAFGQEVLVEPLAEFLTKYPDVTVDWLLLDRSADLIAEGIDCAIRVGGVDEPELVAKQLAEVPRILVAAPGLWGKGEAPKAPTQLQRLPWVALAPYYRDEIELVQARTGRRQRVSIRPRMSSDSLYAVRSAARSGLGAAVVSAWVVADDLASGRLCRLVPDWESPPLPVHLVYPYARLYPARLRIFADWMKQAMSSIPGMRPSRSSTGP